MAEITSGLNWEVSSFCTSGNCVQAAPVNEYTVALRDSKQPDSILTVPSETWHQFLEGVTKGEFA